MEYFSEDESNPIPLFNKIHEMKMAEWNNKSGLFKDKGVLLNSSKFGRGAKQ
jgi:hypothetical protein